MLLPYAQVHWQAWSHDLVSELFGACRAQDSQDHCVSYLVLVIAPAKSGFNPISYSLLASLNMSATQATPVVWRPDDNQRRSPSHPGSSEVYRPDILETIEKRIAELDKELRELSLEIHGAFLSIQCQRVALPSKVTQGFKLISSSFNYISTPRTRIWRIVGHLWRSTDAIWPSGTIQPRARCLHVFPWQARLSSDETLPSGNGMASYLSTWYWWKDYWYKLGGTFSLPSQSLTTIQWRWSIDCRWTHLLV